MPIVINAGDFVFIKLPSYINEEEEEEEPLFPFKEPEPLLSIDEQIERLKSMSREDLLKQLASIGIFPAG